MMITVEEVHVFIQHEQKGSFTLEAIISTDVQHLTCRVGDSRHVGALRPCNVACWLCGVGVKVDGAD